MKLENPLHGELVLESWAGRSYTPITVIRETPKRYEIRNDSSQSIHLAGRDRWLEPGETTIVPKSAVRLKSDGKT